MAAYQAHKNFAYSLIAVAPVPAASGTTFSVTAGQGALFPAAPFNVVVWPTGANPLSTNAEVLTVTSKGTGDDWTATRVQESSSARSIALGDQISAAITAKTFTDIETVTGNQSTGLVGGRLTLTTALPLTVADVNGATTIRYAPHTHNNIGLVLGGVFVPHTFAELSLAVPATTSTMYDVFVYSNSGVATLEALAWTNDTTRATGIVNTNGGAYLKNGDSTRRWVGCFRTTTVSGQTEDSGTKRYVWNYHNRMRRRLAVADATDSWTYTTATYRQANNSASNQVDTIVGLQEAMLALKLVAYATNPGGPVNIAAAIGENSATARMGGMLGMAGTCPASGYGIVSAFVEAYPALGRNYYTWLERSVATSTTTWYGDNSDNNVLNAGISGWIEG